MFNDYSKMVKTYNNNSKDYINNVTSLIDDKDALKSSIEDKETETQRNIKDRFNSYVNQHVEDIDKKIKKEIDPIHEKYKYLESQESAEVWKLKNRYEKIPAFIINIILFFCLFPVSILVGLFFDKIIYIPYVPMGTIYFILFWFIGSDDSPISKIYKPVWFLGRIIRKGIVGGSWENYQKLADQYIKIVKMIDNFTTSTYSKEDFKIAVLNSNEREELLEKNKIIRELNKELDYLKSNLK